MPLALNPLLWPPPDELLVTPGVGVGGVGGGGRGRKRKIGVVRSVYPNTENPQEPVAANTDVVSGSQLLSKCILHPQDNCQLVFSEYDNNTFHQYTHESEVYINHLKTIYDVKLTEYNGRFLLTEALAYRPLTTFTLLPMQSKKRMLGELGKLLFAHYNLNLIIPKRSDEQYNATSFLSNFLANTVVCLDSENYCWKLQFVKCTRFQHTTRQADCKNFLKVFLFVVEYIFKVNTSQDFYICNSAHCAYKPKRLHKYSEEIHSIFCGSPRADRVETLYAKYGIDIKQHQPHNIPPYNQGAAEAFGVPPTN